MDNKNIPPLPWRQGEVLITSTTKRWSSEYLEDANAAERTRIFSNFHDSDEGRSRVVVAEAQNADIAEKIVSAVNHYDSLKVDYERLQQAYYSLSDENRRLTDQLTYARARL